MNDHLFWLLNWYHSHCDGDWEHCWGIKMSTIDNPGWSSKFYLNETELEDQSFKIVDIDRSEND